MADSLEVRIAELEAALENAIWIEDKEWRLIKAAYPLLAPAEAKILALLCKANGVPLTRMDIDQAIPSEKEHRRHNTISVWIHGIRKVMGAGFVMSTHCPGWAGYWLPKESILTITTIIKQEEMA